MQKILMLGTGNGLVYDYFNTCFVIQNDDKIFLVDTGGSAEIIRRFKYFNINLEMIHDIFISHSHTDHILGLFWMLKVINGMYLSNKYEGQLNIYCNNEVAKAIRDIYPYLFPSKYVDHFEEFVNIVVLEDNKKVSIADKEYIFFDAKAKGNKLFGFETILDNKKRLVFLGDETCKQELYDRVRNCDYVMHEAFCLDSEENIFHAYEKNHSTTKSVSEVMNELNVKNLILYHTEESHKEDRKELYTNEAQRSFNGRVIVPDDLEVIELN